MNIKKNARKYFSLDEEQKKQFLTVAYLNENISWIEIARMVDTYPNKIRRDAKRFGIKSRSKREAQAVALKEGRAVHPTQGKPRDEATKLKISESQGRVWDDLTSKERAHRSKIGKESWDKKTEQEKLEVIQKGGEGVRRAARLGSKMEHFLLNELTKRKYKVQFHKDHWLKNQRLQLDLYQIRKKLVLY